VYYYINTPIDCQYPASFPAMPTGKRALHMAFTDVRTGKGVASAIQPREALK
jgi:hypothetical protein